KPGFTTSRVCWPPLSMVAGAGIDRMPPLAPDNIQSILCVRFGRLGDILLLLPAIASLKARLPGRQIVLATDHRYVRAAELCPSIDAVIPINRLHMRDGSKPGALKAITALVRDIRRRR